MEFVKAHGTGNDFVVVPDLDEKLEITPAQVRAVCDRRFGVGGDGLIRITPGRIAPFFMDYRNADGTIAEMCGNGVRVVGKYLGDRGHAGDTLDLETRGGVKHLTLQRGAGGLVEQVTVDMGAPAMERAALPLLGEGDTLRVPLEVDGGWFTATCVSMGNPHTVLFVDDVETAPVATLGPRLETHELFPNRTNVEFVQVVDEHTVLQRTWERGVGETLACGTGACAVAVASRLRGHTGGQVTARLRGGDLRLSWEPGGTVTMTGPAVEVATGTLHPELLGAD